LTSLGGTAGRQRSGDSGSTTSASGWLRALYHLGIISDIIARFNR
jgi:hypothetical protein